MTSDTRQGNEKLDQAKEEGKHLTDEVRDKGSEIGHQAKQEMDRVVDDVRHKTREQADDQARRAAGALRDASGQLRSMAEGSGNEGMLIDLTRDGADRIGRFADHLEQDGIQGVVDDVERFARQRPGLFIAAGVGLGVVLGRMIKAGGEVMQEDQRHRYGDGLETSRQSRTPVTAASAPRSVTDPSSGVRTPGGGV